MNSGERILPGELTRAWPDCTRWLREGPGGETGSPHRLDGIHWTFDGSDDLGAWVVPRILDAVTNDRVGRDGHTGRPAMGEAGGEQ